MPDRPIRILMLSISWDPEPGALRGLPLAKWLSAHGYEVQALTAFPWYPLGHIYPGYKQRLWQWETMEGIRVLRVPLLPSHDSSAIRRILTYLSFMWSAVVFGIANVKKPDIVYYFDNLPTTGFVAWLISLIYGAKMVQHIADMWPDTPIESGMIRSPFLKSTVQSIVGGWCKFLYRRHKRITVLSPGFRRMLLERGVPDEKIVLSYNWADESKFFPVPRNADLLRELGLEGRVNVLYAGNIGPLQSIDTVIRAAALVKGDPRLQIVILGTGPSEADIKSLAAELQTTNVKFLGRRPVEQMNDINALADAQIVILRDIPFMHNTIPSKTQVALASGRPILMGVQGDARELVERSGAGISFASEDPAGLAMAMRQLADRTESERQAMGENGRKFYENTLSFAIGAKINDEMFRAVARQVG